MTGASMSGQGVTRLVAVKITQEIVSMSGVLASKVVRSGGGVRGMRIVHRRRGLVVMIVNLLRLGQPVMRMLLGFQKMVCGQSGALVKKGLETGLSVSSGVSVER